MSGKGRGGKGVCPLAYHWHHDQKKGVAEWGIPSRGIRKGKEGPGNSLAFFSEGGGKTDNIFSYADVRKKKKGRRNGSEKGQGCSSFHFGGTLSRGGRERRGIGGYRQITLLE